VYRYTTTVGHDLSFERDATTRLCYAALAGYAFWLYAFGPALALLRSELHFSYTMLGAHSALWSGGAALAGAAFAPVARRLPRARLLWCSALGAAAGAGLFVTASTVSFTLLGALVLGFAGTTMLTLTQAMLSDRHGPQRDRALTEANVGAAGCAVLAPLVLGLLHTTTASGWRLALVLPVVLLASLYLRYRHHRLPARPGNLTDDRRAGLREPLSPTCLLLATLVAVCMGVEFCLVYFGAELLASTGMGTAQAATSMSAFFLGLLAGRVGGAVLTRRSGRIVTLLWISLAVIAAGFLLVWLSGGPVLAIAGLLVCGLGVANLYPLSLALTLAAAPGNSDAANARTQLLGGAAVTIAPYLLGNLADHVGLRAAFSIEATLVAIAAALLVTAVTVGRRTPEQEL
jgi:MFS family permease